MSHPLVKRYAAGASLPAQSIAGLTASDLDAFPVPGTWSIRQIISHLMDSDLIAADRMKRVVAEDNPLLTNYDENRFVQTLRYESASPEDMTEVFRLNRVITAHVLRGVDETAWSRTGTHNVRGKLSLTDLVRGYSDHLDHHLKFIRQKRALLGKPARD